MILAFEKLNFFAFGRFFEAFDKFSIFLLLLALLALSPISLLLPALVEILIFVAGVVNNIILGIESSGAVILLKLINELLMKIGKANENLNISY